MVEWTLAMFRNFGFQSRLHTGFVAPRVALRKSRRNSKQGLIAATTWEAGWANFVARVLGSRLDDGGGSDTAFRCAVRVRFPPSNR
jgi:hypothetical protein